MMFVFSCITAIWLILSAGLGRAQEQRAQEQRTQEQRTKLIDAAATSGAVNG